MELITVECLDSEKMEWRDAKIAPGSLVDHALNNEPGEHFDFLRTVYRRKN